MKRPLVMVALIYAAGILAADFFPWPHFPLLGAAWIAGLMTLLWARARPGLLGLLLFLTGAANLTFRAALISPQDLRALQADRVDYISLHGTLRETPYHRIYEHGEGESWRSVAIVNVTSLRKTGAPWQPATGRVAVKTPGVLPGHFFGGRQVEISGILSPPKGPTAEGLFDYRSYLRRHGIHYQLQVASGDDWRAVSPPSPPPVADRFNAWAKATLARGLPAEDEPLRLLWAMTLGWKTGLTGEVSEPFMRSGTMHIFAISGLHIALIAGILVALLRVCRVPRSLCGLLVIPLIWSYTGVTGWQASAIRSTVMMTVIIAGWSLKRPSDLLNSLAAAAFIILLWDPQQLFQASFQLSFFVVLSLALFVPVLEAIRERFFKHDPLLPLELRPLWKRLLLPDPALRAGAGWHWPWLDLPMQATRGLVTSLAAWLGSIPLIAYYFHLFTPVSLLANVIVVPLSSLALMSNLASLITGSWFPACAELFNHSAWLWMLWMVRISQWCAALPGGCWHMAPPHLMTFALYYAALLSIVSGSLRKPELRFKVGAGLALLTLVWIFQWQAGRSVTRLTILPLSGGNAIHLDAPGRKGDWLIDCGNEAAVAFTTRPFLQAKGINYLSHFLLTHGDLHHIGGAEVIRRDFAAEQIYLSPIRFRSAAYKRLQEQFEADPGLVRHLERSQRLGPWTVLHPASTDKFSLADDNTIVLLGEIQGTRLLLLSDLGKPGQNVLMERNPELRADIVIAGLPRQSEPLADALIEAIRPRVIIITDGEFPATERASRKLQQRLAEHSVPVLYTRETRAITLSFRRNSWELRTMNGVRIRSDAPIDAGLTPAGSPSRPHDGPEE